MAFCRQAIGIKKELEAIVLELQAEEDLPSINVELIDPCTARLFESSKRAKVLHAFTSKVMYQ